MPFNNCNSFNSSRIPYERVCPVKYAFIRISAAQQSFEYLYSSGFEFVMDVSLRSL